MPRRVARTMAHGQGTPANLDRVAVMQPFSGCEWLRSRKAKHGALLYQLVDPELIGFMRTQYGQIKFYSQFTCSACMVDVCMGQPDGTQRQIPSGHFLQDAIQIASWVNDCSLSCFIAPDQRTVLLKGCNGNGVVLKHGNLMTVFAVDQEVGNSLFDALC